MKLRATIATLLAIQVLSMAAVGRAAENPPAYDNYTFTETLKPWAFGSADDCVKGGSLQLKEEIVMSPQPPNRYAALTDDCDGAVWMVARLEGSGNTFQVAFDARNVEGCEGCIPIVYVGKGAPKGKEQFTTDFVSLEGGWQTHKFNVKLPEDSGGGKPGIDRVYVAIGLANLDLERPELPQTIGVDNIAVTSGESIIGNSRPDRARPVFDKTDCLACEPVNQ